MLRIKSRMDNGDNRRFKIQYCGQVTPKMLLERCLVAHGCANQSEASWQLFWVDSDGDHITIATQDDLDQAVMEADGAVLKVTLRLADPAAPLQTTCSEPAAVDTDYIMVSSAVPTSPVQKLISQLEHFDQSKLRKTPPRAKSIVVSDHGRSQFLESIRAAGGASKPVTKVTNTALVKSIKDFGGYDGFARSSPTTAPSRLFVDQVDEHTHHMAKIKAFDRTKLRPVVTHETTGLLPVTVLRAQLMTEIRSRPADSTTSEATPREDLLAAIKQGTSLRPTAQRTPKTAAPITGHTSMLMAAIANFDRSDLAAQDRRSMNKAVLAMIREFPRRKRALTKVVPKVLHPAQSRSKLAKHRARTVCSSLDKDRVHLHAKCMAELVAKSIDKKPVAPLAQQHPSRAVLKLVKDFPTLRHCLRSPNESRA
eukprot:m.465240 g.465240  ORF g.465240 m.465240 type:complete len:424 (+) comp24058_c0_seq1:228-1499(+)